MPTEVLVDAEIHPLSHRSTNDAVFRLAVPSLRPGARVLDLGAGHGFFSRMVGEFIRDRLDLDPGALLAACDPVPDNFRYGGVTCDPMPDAGRLPYADGAFDVVCSLEVVEHVEDQFEFCREIMRVLKPGGVAILSTPNVLNLNSRLRVLHSGFATLFDPLPLSTSDAVHTSGHIHPVSYYYLAYALKRAGAESVSVAFDRQKKSARLLRLLFWPIITAGNAGLRLKLRRKRPQIFEENRGLLDELWSSGMLLSRSIVVQARKAQESTSTRL